MSEPAAGPVFSYDAVAYPTPVVAAQTPNRIASAGLVHGWAAPDPLTASVFEIGCGDGLNLIAIAAANPEARCIGFDLSAPAIERGRNLAAAAGITNVELHPGDILTWPRDGERFDYILCHGIYSWVPDEVRAPLMALMGARLAPGGVAFMSYDCLPGAIAKRAINRFLVARLGGIADPGARIEAARQMIAILAANQRPDSRLRSDLLGLARRKDVDANYFFHDWLSEYYTPATAAQVGAEAAVAGLGIAGDAGLTDLYLGGLEENAMKLLAAEPDAALRLEMLDMLTGDMIFRRSLLVRRDAPPAAAPDGLMRLRFAFYGTREPAEDADGPLVVYSSGAGSRLDARRPDQQALMDALAAAAPGELTRDELRAATGIAEAELDQLLRTLTVAGLITSHATPQNFVVTPGPRPLVGPLPRIMAARGRHVITPRHHQSSDFADATRLLVTLCDGTRTAGEIAAEISALAGANVTTEAIEQALVGLSREAIFLA